MTSQASRRPPSNGNDAIESGALVFLRRPNINDRAEWVALREASLDHLLPWEPRTKVKSERERWEAFFSTSDSEERKRFLICLKEDGKLVGYVGLNGIRHGSLQGCDLGYWTGKPFLRRGYMTEAVRLAIRHAFRSLELHRVEANIQPHNEASIAVAKKVGMRYEGTALRFLRIDGKWCDHERWALTIEEWEDMPRADRQAPTGSKSKRKPKTP